MKTLLAWLLLFNSLTVLAQKQATYWYFAQRVGLKFAQGCQPVTTNDSQMLAEYDATTMSDRQTGQLLFYTNSFQIWNRQHRIMPNGDSLKGTPWHFELIADQDIGYLTQGSLAVPMPGDSTRYYLFTLLPTWLKQPATSGELYASIVDMNADGGLGDVPAKTKNQLLTKNVLGRLTAVPHTNGRDVWVLTHLWNSNAFLVYPLTPAGIGRADTIRIGSVIKADTTTDQGVNVSLQSMQGCLKASPDGRKLACTSFSTKKSLPIDLFDFDATTGRITNYVPLGTAIGQFGLSFSPDNTKLYVVTKEPVRPAIYPEFIRQYDLSLGSTAAIIASGKSIIYNNPYTNIPQRDGPGPPGGAIMNFAYPALQIGLDGRIYCPADANGGIFPGDDSHVLIINQPNAPGFACDVQLESLNVRPGVVAGGGSAPPNFMQSYFNGLVPTSCPSALSSDTCPVTDVVLFPNPARETLQISVGPICALPYLLRLINAAGQVLLEATVDRTFSDHLWVKPFPAGVYFVELRLGNQRIVRRWIKG